MSKSAPTDHNKGFLSSTNIKQTYNLERSCQSSRLSAKKSTNDKPTAVQVVGEFLVVTEPLMNLTGTPVNHILYC